MAGLSGYLVFMGINLTFRAFLSYVMICHLEADTEREGQGQDDEDEGEGGEQTPAYTASKVILITIYTRHEFNLR